MKCVGISRLATSAAKRNVARALVTRTISSSTNRLRPGVEGTGASSEAGPVDSSWIMGSKGTVGMMDSLGPLPQDATNEMSRSWSSPNDIVARGAFSKDNNRLWPLLETYLEAKEFKRAEAILTALNGSSSATDVTLAVNKYLMALVELNANDPSVARKWYQKKTKKLSYFRPNAATEAILLHNLYMAGQMDKVQEFVEDYQKNGHNIAAVLNQVEVLPVKAVREIVKLCGINQYTLSRELREMLSLYSTDQSAADATTLHSTAFDITSEEEVPSLRKGELSEIKAVPSASLKAIRHSLGGLLSSDEVQKAFSPYLAGKDPNDYVDFLELYKKLKPEQVEEFEREFDAFNRRRQRALEYRGYEGAQERWKKDFERQDRGQAIQDRHRKQLDKFLYEWNEAMLPLVKKEFALLKEILKYPDASKVPAHLKSDSPINVTTADRFEYGPYLLLAKPENLPAITMLDLLSLSASNSYNSQGMRTARAVLSVGKMVEMEYRKAQSKKRENSTFSGFKYEPSNPNAETVIEELRMKVQEGTIAQPSQTSWPSAIWAKIGSLLISMFLSVAKVPVKGTDPLSGREVTSAAPAFYHSYQYQQGSRVGVIKTHRNLAQMLSTENLAATIQPQQFPMLVKPVPWTAWNRGGYIYFPSKIMRSKDAPEQIAYLKAASDAGQLDNVYEGLNVLGETAWTVNKRMYDIISKVWNEGTEFLDIPPNVTMDYDLPPPPPRDADPTVRRDWKRTCREIYNKQQALYSQRCDINYKVEVARAFLGERFYFPHNMDFRGRAYPLPPHLNHLGNDLSRSLLVFWDGKELGESGLRWLKIHIANLYGNDKMSFDDRVKFVDENLDKVIDSAENPLEGKYKWWQSADKPWQTLSACMDLADALKLPDPTKHVSRVPVHQDGTCNGLQHYAALGGDPEGAAEVNLIPNSKPQDVYVRVLRIVEGYVKEDAEAGLADAKMLHGRLSRKVIKQTVMTHVYGVTFIGARSQIRNRLKEWGDLDEVVLYRLSCYLASQVLRAVRYLFYGAHLIQDWLADNATLISRSIRLDVDKTAKTGTKKLRPDYMSSVIWTTPLGLPIVQPYREDTKKQVKTSIQSVFIADPYAYRGVNTRKQKTAFPPNYVHSLDATHMLMTAIGCGKLGISFASVHDSYWTHAGDVDRMNKIVREAFIELHGMDLVGRLSDEFKTRYAGMLHEVDIPKDSDLARTVQEVEDQYAEQYGVKKLTLAQHIEIERERRRLLNSKDEHERQKGEQMTTPVSLVEQYTPEELLELATEARNIADSTGSLKPQMRKFRSTEHAGTGADLFEKYEKDMGRLQEANADQETVGAADESTGESTSEIASEIASESTEDAEVGTSGSDTGGLVTKAVQSAHERASGSPMAAMAYYASQRMRARKHLKTILVPLSVPPTPPRGDLDVNVVRDSEYFFS